jgi:plasmid maintenance system killer protein
MIRGFRDRATEAVFNGERPKGFPADLVKVARRATSASRPATDWKRLPATGEASIRSGSTTSSGFAFAGRRKDRPTLK